MSPSTITLHTSILFDPKQNAFLTNRSIEANTQTGAIARIFERETAALSSPLPPNHIDLTNKFVLPGLVDAHTHIFLHSYKERPATQQMRDQSLVERTVRATNHARAALLAGYTTYRDLGTEALGNADANLRDCVNRGLTPGPRMFVATEAIASSGSYEIRVENRIGTGGGREGLALRVPRAADVADGVEGVRAAVRRRVGEGADVIKVYADYRRKVMRWPNDVVGPGGKVLFPPERRNPAVPAFSLEELKGIVEEAGLAEMPVAAHTGETKAALMAVRAGVTTVEHIFEDSAEIGDELFREMAKTGTIWVPTLATAELLAPEVFAACKARVKKAYDMGVRLAAGGDTGTFNHGLNVREMEIMVEAGIPVEAALVVGTYRGWEACGKDACGFKFGWFEVGNRADIVALDTDPREDVRALRNVSFVMKDGRVWKRDGVPVDMVSVPQWPDEEEDSPAPSSADYGLDEFSENSSPGSFGIASFPGSARGSVFGASHPTHRGWRG